MNYKNTIIICLTIIIAIVVLASLFIISTHNQEQTKITNENSEAKVISESQSATVED